MIGYFDTSAVLPLLIDEPASEVAGRMWDTSDRVVSVRLIYPEARAALAQANRLGRLTAYQLRAAVDQLDRLVAQFHIVEVTEILARRAGQLAEEQRVRGYDAVHLAAAEAVNDPDTIVVAGDRELCDAAGRLGINFAQL
ncbi:MAG: type II toxin-antitoxin system VapC family toxin [Acidimicrobiia bacterium]